MMSAVMVPLLLLPLLMLLSGFSVFVCSLGHINPDEDPQVAPP